MKRRPTMADIDAAIKVVHARRLGRIRNSLPDQVEHGHYQSGNGGLTEGAHYITGRPEMTCWCDRKVVETTWEAIFNGEGVSCGRKGCEPPHTC